MAKIFGAFGHISSFQSFEIAINYLANRFYRLANQHVIRFLKFLYFSICLVVRFGKSDEILLGLIATCSSRCCLSLPTPSSTVSSARGRKNAPQNSASLDLHTA
jgi:hypothetical protein